MKFIFNLLCALLFFFVTSNAQAFSSPADIAEKQSMCFDVGDVGDVVDGEHANYIVYSVCTDEHERPRQSNSHVNIIESYFKEVTAVISATKKKTSKRARDWISRK